MNKIDLFEKSTLDSIDFSDNPLKVEHGISPSYAGENLIMRPLNTEDYDKGTKFCQLTTRIMCSCGSSGFGNVFHF